MGRVRFRGRDRVRTTFSDRNFVQGSTKYVLLGKSHWPYICLSGS